MSTLGISTFAPDIAGTVRLAGRADTAGLDGVWTSELFNRSATIPLAAMATATSACRVGSAITYGVGRSPLTMAAEARDLDELSEGRFVLGLGNGTRRMISDWHGQDPASPALRMEELIPLIRALWRAHEQAIEHTGRFYRLSFRPIGDVPPPLREAIPIFTAGVGRRMIEVAGRVADGFIGHPIFSLKYIDEVARPAVQRGAAMTGRSAGEVEIASMVICVVHDDVEQARAEAASQIAFYSSVKSYDCMLAVDGFEAEGVAIREAFHRRDLGGMRRAVSDRMIDAMSVAGTAADVRAGLRRYEAALDHTIIYSPTHGLSAERVEQNLLSLIDTVALEVAS